MSDQLVSVKDILDIVYNYSSAPDSYYYAGKHQQIVGWAAAAARIRGGIERHAADLTDAGVVFDDVETNDAT